jgi:DNA polymerase III subunit epsilon
VVARSGGTAGRRNAAAGSQLDLWSLLPAALSIDASDRSRVGIRIGLREPVQAVLRRPAAVDCGASAGDDVSIRDLEYAIVDVETTGGSCLRGHRITEIAAVRVDGRGRVVDEYRSLVNPERPIPSFISALTNITWDMVADAPRFRDVAADVARVLGGAVFVAHNAAFDWRFVAHELERVGASLTGRSLCTVRLARKVVPEVRSRSLDSLTYFFDIPVAARHRAYGDAAATAELFRRLLDRLDTLEVTRWCELQELLRRRAPRRRRVASPQPIPEV